MWASDGEAWTKKKECIVEALRLWSGSLIIAGVPDGRVNCPTVGWADTCLKCPESWVEPMLQWYLAHVTIGEKNHPPSPSNNPPSPVARREKGAYFPCTTRHAVFHPPSYPSSSPQCLSPFRYSCFFIDQYITGSFCDNEGQWPYAKQKEGIFSHPEVT